MNAKQKADARTKTIMLCILDTALRPDGGRWDEIRDAVKAKLEVRPNGWMEVRGVLQFLINQKMIARSPDFTIEKYVAGTVEFRR